ncbi:uncharacterized protein LOC6614774 isoform X3 [Drosophila sechellia]|uniref:Uncharacterized protein, isoform D n=2 Tax=melanogaster subgroup TaxID=32351 RepID=A0A0J9R4W0_DROSI|nr:uncharacterized protein LOC6732897 isoform X3 [Drosophila simulans]XP_032582950.1 uncharacterized protein LOC6614774 isoform X3 [Drosophila sechellia]XP_033151350.1 uncharacterized protein LOC117135288 isoform X3 [Drosophila mauritiana]KMY91128.1 uncharacterized protein Dsimw501_GD21716, isoform D [Drosophila simulans]
MDVWGFCVSDTTMAYGGSMRSGYYRDYEEFPYGTLESTTSSHAVKDCYSRVQALKDGKKLSKGNCKCEPSACKCGKRQQRQQQLKLLVSQLRRRDNVSSVILF